MTTTLTPAAAKKDTQKLQRAIIDGLEDVKAQDIQVFDTEHITSLFERVIVASGASNRQTKALAASVVDAVRDAGFSKPRLEGTENGEWIIADCGACVVHIMQPVIRQYYHLEEIWGEKPVRLKLGASKPVVTVKAVAKKVPAKKAAAKKVAKKAPAKTSKNLGVSSKAAVASSGATKKVAAKKAPAKKAAAKKTTSTTRSQ